MRLLADPRGRVQSAGLTSAGLLYGAVVLLHGLAVLPAASSSRLLNLDTVFTVLIADWIGKGHLGRPGTALIVLALPIGPCATAFRRLICWHCRLLE